MSNAVLFKKRKLMFAPQANIGTYVEPSATTYVLPCEDIDFNLDRGELNISRSGLSTGLPASVIHARGGAGWSVSFTAEIHDSEDLLNPSLYPLVVCGMKAAEESGTAVYTLALGCLLEGLDGDLPEGPGVASMTLVEDCGVTKKAKDCTGNATFTFEAGQRAMVAYELIGRTGAEALEDTVVETTGTEQAWGTVEDWRLPYVCTAMRIKVDGEDPVNLESVELNLNMDVSDANDPLDPSGLGVVKPELQEYLEVSFNVAQDSYNKELFWTKFFNGSKVTLDVELDGPDGGSLSFDMQNLRHDPPSTEDVNGRRHYGMTCHGFIDPSELGDVDAAFENLLKITYTPSPSASS